MTHDYIAQAAVAVALLLHTQRTDSATTLCARKRGSRSQETRAYLMTALQHQCVRDAVIVGSRHKHAIFRTRSD
ncbi:MULTISPECIES: hypothetical protein [unclassified Xanthomonas]|uniref:hypothetical protein n=1 Tax=unclassified Xanthomonas TaxID=2643310 RepID=UPI000CEE393D|nr:MULTISPECIES: hypothetical protein [unclassified Xanthomonas]PPU36974.1 hypothetical protein XspCFBP7912_03830 [Xanthomonas sp. CFBP 7912]RJS05180.1 hypothetical protein XnspCFBP7698_02805 [Xanthomonas sp. CFBP 7698]